MTTNKIYIHDTPVDIAKAVAQQIAQLIRERQQQGKMAVLCLPTGSTPIPTYQELIRLHKEEGLSFKNVVSFNLDEYYPMKPDDKNSYHYFMNETFFKHVDIPRENVHIPEGTLPMSEVDTFCTEYESKIREHGGIDLAMVGIGRTGHVGFNEPPSTESDRTRLVTLHRTTIVDAAPAFGGEDLVPRNAITMGVGTVMDCRRVILIATGQNKADIVHKLVEEEMESFSECPAAFLRNHSDAQFYFDKAAAQKLTTTLY